MAMSLAVGESWCRVLFQQVAIGRKPNLYAGSSPCTCPGLCLLQVHDEREPQTLTSPGEPELKRCFCADTYLDGYYRLHP